MLLTETLKQILIQTAQQLKGSARRVFMARIVEALGKGGQRRAQRELHWCRDTIRKGQHELETGMECVDAFAARGRKPVEAHLPNLINDMRAIVEGQAQTDPTFRTPRLYTRVSASEVRCQLLEQKGYTDAELPSVETIRLKLNEQGYSPCRVAKSKPLKKPPKTDAIFEQLHRVNTVADEDPTQLRISLDAKATVLLGHLSRNGTNRVKVQAWDHDFAEGKITPFGFLLPEHDELYLYFTQSSVTSDFIVDCLCDLWSHLRHRFPDVRTLVLNQDNGPEVQSHRTQFIHRLVQFVDAYDITVQLAYYPPYHSKYNPIERAWGVLERHWNGSLLDSVATVLCFAQTMTWKGIHPVVELVHKVYQTGVCLTKKAMQALEERLERLQGLERWFVKIRPISDA